MPDSKETKKVEDVISSSELANKRQRETLRGRSKLLSDDVVTEVRKSPTPMQYLSSHPERGKRLAPILEHGTNTDNTPTGNCRNIVEKA